MYRSWNKGNMGTKKKRRRYREHLSDKRWRRKQRLKQEVQYRNWSRMGCTAAILIIGAGIVLALRW